MKNTVFENQCNDFIYVFVLINKRINIRSKFIIANLKKYFTVTANLNLETMWVGSDTNKIIVESFYDDEITVYNRIKHNI
jgi:hypothetical protein